MALHFVQLLMYLINFIQYLDPFHSLNYDPRISMRMRYKYIIMSVALLCIVGWGSFNLLLDTSDRFAPQNKSVATSKTIMTEGAVGSNFWTNKTMKTLHAQAQNLSPDVLKASLAAYLKARKLGLNEKQVLTIVDYSLPSTERRLWVIDMKNLKVLFNTWVAHGTNSGGATPTSFSNQPRSLKSSLGVFITDATYVGGKGYSLRLKGLEHNINDNVYDRKIVFHGAWYVNAAFAKAKGMMGRSWGCFAVDTKIVKSLINTIKEKSVVVAYYPDKNWLRHSNFIN